MADWAEATPTSVLAIREEELTRLLSESGERVVRYQRHSELLLEEVQTHKDIIDQERVNCECYGRELGQIRWLLVQRGEPIRDDEVAPFAHQPMDTTGGRMDVSIKGMGKGDGGLPMSADIVPRMNEEVYDGRALDQAIVAQATLWVRQLPLKWSEWWILQLFNRVNDAYPENACNVVGCNFAYRDSGDKKIGTGMAHFLYATVELAEFARMRLNGLFVEGRQLDVRLSTKPLEFGWSPGGPIRGQTRTGARVWKCPDGSLDPRLSWRP